MTLIQSLQSDFQSAKDNHDGIMTKVNDWRSEIYETYSNGSHNKVQGGDKHRSQLMMRDIEKIVESSIPSLVEPFVGNDELISAEPKDLTMGQGSMIVSALLNQQWNKEIDTVDFMTDFAKVLQVDGTSIIKVGWLDNKPDISLVPFEEVFFDPSARSVNDIKFAIQKRRVQIVEVLNNPEWYGEHAAEDLYDIISVVPDDTYTGNDTAGSDSNFNYEEGIRQYVDVYEYYGQMEMDGEVKNILAIFNGNKLLNVFDSPYPDVWNGIPFDLAQYTKRPYSIFGDSVAQLIGDYQKVRSGFMREILNNANNANSSQKWNKKGALDINNKKRMMKGLDFETNVEPDRALVHGEFNQVPASVFSIVEQFKVEQEEMTGIGRLNSGLDPRALNGGTSATAANLVQGNAEKRLLQIVRSMSSALKRVFSKMLDMNMMMLEDTVIKINGQEVPVNAQMLQGRFRVEIDVQTPGKITEQNNNLIMMLQQMTAYRDVIPSFGELVAKMLSKMASNVKLSQVSMALKTSPQQMQMMQQQQQQIQDLQMQLEIATSQSEISKNNAKAMLDEAKAVESHIDAQTKAYGV